MRSFHLSDGSLELLNGDSSGRQAKWQGIRLISAYHIKSSSIILNDGLKWSIESHDSLMRPLCYLPITSLSPTQEPVMRFSRFIIAKI